MSHFYIYVEGKDGSPRPTTAELTTPTLDSSSATTSEFMETTPHSSTDTTEIHGETSSEESLDAASVISTAVPNLSHVASRDSK